MDKASLQILCTGLSIAFVLIGWGAMKICVAKAADIERRSMQQTGITGMRLSDWNWSCGHCPER